MHTHGCKLNQAESEKIAVELAEIGYIINDDGPADVIVLNTCTVTHVADRKARQWLSQARRQNPSSFIIATGCYVERAAKDFAALGTDLVCGNSDKIYLTRLISELLGPPVPSNILNPNHFKPRTRSFVKVQDGCRGPCAYCIVPIVRSRVYSKPPDEIIAEVRHRIASGYREVVLTGTEIGNYHYQMDDLSSLITRILNETSIERLRLSSLQPEHITPKMLVLWQDRRLARHFHIALQSGCNEILKTMGRRYTKDTYLETLNLIRKHIPDVAVTTDLIIGFPGESDDAFNESYNFADSCGFSAIHVFPFSPRPGTVAAGMPNQVPERVKRERTLKALELARNSAGRFRGSAIGSVQDVLWEAELSPGSGIYTGLTSNYLRVFTRSEQDITNRILRVRLTRIDGNRLWSELR